MDLWRIHRGALLSIWQYTNVLFTTSSLQITVLKLMMIRPLIKHQLKTGN